MLYTWTDHLLPFSVSRVYEFSLPGLGFLAAFLVQEVLYSFQIGVFVNNKSSYTFAKPGIIDINVKAIGREGKKTKLGFHFKDDRFRIESTCGASLDEENLPTQESEMLDIHLKLHAENAKPRDVISFTVTLSEIENDVEFDRRGVSTIVHLV